MANPIKYNTGSESRALNKGNFYIGTGDVDKGPTSSTGFWAGITPPAGGYTIYVNKESQGPSIQVAYSDAELISITNKIAGSSYTTVNECLLYFASQNDKVVLNRDYEGIVTDGLVLNVDAGFTPSYPKSGNTWYDVSVNTNNGTLTNGPTFSSANGGSIVFDGVDDYMTITGPNFGINDDFTYSVWFYTEDLNRYWTGLICPYASYRYHTLYATHPNRPLYYFADENGASTAIYGVDWDSIGWHHLVVTREVNDYKMYQDGESTNHRLSGTSQDINNIRIGNAGGSNYFSGKIPIVKIYNRALTESEILQNFNAQKARFGL